MPEDVLSTQLAALRKDILAQILDPLISEGVSASIEPPSTLVLTPVQPHQPVPSLRTLFHFICTQLLPHLPTAHQVSFASSFYVPLTTSLTTHLLTPAIPNSLSGLPPFLTLIKDVVQVESEVSEMGFMAGKERRIFEWSQGARGHYERKRRVDLIEKARSLVLQPSRGNVKIDVEVEVQGAEVVDLTEQTTVGVKAQGKTEPKLELEVEEDANAWEFDEGDEKNAETKAEQNEDGNKDGWGFEDEGVVDAAPTSSTDVDDDDPWSQEWSDPLEVRPASPLPPKQLVASASQKGQPSAPIRKKAKSMRKESYLVSQVATALASIAEDVLREGSESLDSRWVTLFPTRHGVNVSCAASLKTMVYPRQALLTSFPPPPQFLTSSAHSTQFLAPLSSSKTSPPQWSTQTIAYTWLNGLAKSPCALIYTTWRMRKLCEVSSGMSLRS